MEEQKKDHGRLPFQVIFFPMAVACANHLQGLVLGWPTILPKIQSDNSTSFEVTDNDVKWLVSMTGISGMVATLAVGPIIEVLGPRRLLFWLQVPSIILWLLKAFTPYISILYLSRIGLSFIFSVYGPLVPLLVCEMSDPKIRGFILASEETIMASWLLIMYISAQSLSWQYATAICAIPSAMLFVIYVLLPESPYWLARNGQLDKAERSIYKLRASKEVAAHELAYLADSVKENPHTGTRKQIIQLMHKQNFLPVLFVSSIYILRELGGEYVVFTYTVYVIQESGIELDPYTCTVMIGGTRALFTLFSSLLSDRLGRRPLLLITTLGCCLSAAVFGISLVFEVPGASWICFISLLIYVASYGLGIGPIPWGLTGEMIPTPVRSIGSSICIFSYSLSMFGVGYLFPVLIDFLSMGYMFLIFAGVLFHLFSMLWFLLPETNGRSLNELQDAFKSSKKKQIVSTITDTFTCH